MSDLKTLVENYFAPKPKTLTKQMLYEIFDEVMNEAKADDAFRKEVLSFLKNDYPEAKIIKPTSKSFMVTNIGSRPTRSKAIKSLEDKYGLKPTKQKKVLFGGEFENGDVIELKQGSVGGAEPNATEVEEFFIAAIDQAQEDKIYQKHKKKYGEEVANAYLDLAKSAIAGLSVTDESGTESNPLKGKKVQKTSGKGMAQLSPLYKDVHNVRSKEPKTDFIAGEDKISAKRKGASQYSSAQANEFAAMVDYVFIEKKYDTNVRDYVINLINTTLTRENRAFYNIRESKVFETKTDFDKQMTRLLFRVPSETEQQSKWLNSVQGVLSLECAKVSDEVLQEYIKIFSKRSFRTALLHEAMTGTGKFKGGEKSPAVPNYLLEWDLNDPNKTDYAKITDDLVNKKMDFTLLRISDRGDGRGGAARSDAKDQEVRYSPEFGFAPFKDKKLKNENYINEYAPSGLYGKLVDPELYSKPEPTEIEPEIKNYIDTLLDIIEASASKVKEKISNMTATQILDYFGGIIEYQYTEPKDLIDPEED
jgi:hypothetical protein